MLSVFMLFHSFYIVPTAMLLLFVSQVIRHYHGHLSGVHTMAIHPTIDILVTGGRDSAARVSYI